MNPGSGVNLPDGRTTFTIGEGAGRGWWSIDVATWMVDRVNANNVYRISTPAGQRRIILPVDLDGPPISEGAS